MAISFRCRAAGRQAGSRPLAWLEILCQDGMFVMRWENSPPDQDAAARLAREVGVSKLLARLLALRGIDQPEAAERFLHPALGHLHDPYLMADMPPAAARLRRAIEQGEKILIYGDYDVDGTMAVVVLLTALRSLGASVDAYIPRRLTDGYGMRVPVIEQAHCDGYHVVLSVDTGIREHEVLERARELGLDCIVTDHHLPKDHLPPACAILNPRRADCAYPEKNLSGVGVAFKLAQALLAERMTGRQLESYLKIVCLGTIADVVPLVGENRVIARFGLAGLRDPAQPGLAALINVSGLQGREVTTGDVGFRLAPRLNAAGRMEDARDVIELFTTSDTARARAIAERLDGLNRERQLVEEQILAAIEEEMARCPEKAQRYTLVFSGEDWHRGVIGIVAQRIVDRYHRAALVIGVEDGVGVGSGRSIRGFHLLDALTQTADLFDRFGGHAQAAGFMMAANLIPELEARFELHARAMLAPKDLEPTLRVDAEVRFSDLNWAIYEELAQLEPFGFGNPTPVFAARGARIVAPPRVLKEKHLKLRVTQGGSTLDALGWGMAERAAELRPGDALDLAFTLDENYYQGERTLQLIIKDFSVV
jgi:single-stranded-DNA-specific exonuclease